VVAADHSKCDQKMSMVLGPLAPIDVLVTDQEPPTRCATPSKPPASTPSSPPEPLRQPPGRFNQRGWGLGQAV